MRRLLVLIYLSIGLLFLAGAGGYALQISRIEFDLRQAAGIYRALATIDYAGDNLAGGARNFRLH